MPFSTLPWNSDISAFTSDINKSIVIITQAAAIYPNMPWLGFYLNTINIMSSTTFKLQIAYDYMFTLFQLQTFASQLYPLSSTINCLIGGYPQVRRKMDGSWNLKNDPEWFSYAACLTKRARAIIFTIIRQNEVLSATTEIRENRCKKWQSYIQTT